MDFSQIVITSYVTLQILVIIMVSILASSTIFKFLALNKDWKPKFSKSSIFYLWFRITWKMRAIYGSLLVHIFDFFTDLLVIHQWYTQENNKDSDVVEHVNTPLMASWSIAVLIFHRVISSLAIYVTTQYNIKYAILQFFDILLFIEIYNSHAYLVNSILTKNNLNNPQSPKSISSLISGTVRIHAYNAICCVVYLFAIFG